MQEETDIMLDKIDMAQSDMDKKLKGVFTNDKEKIIKQTGPLPEKVNQEVDSMSGVGTLIFDKGRTEGRIEGRIEGLKKFVYVIQRYMNKHDVDAETACEELDADYEEYKEACEMIASANAVNEMENV